MINKHEYALKLENCFRRNGRPVVTADAFETNYVSALERGLYSLAAQNILSTQEMSAWMEEFSLGNATLDTIVHTPVKLDKLNELLTQLSLITAPEKEVNG